MKLRKRKPYFHSDEATQQPPQYLAGDPVRTRDGKQGIVGHSRRDGLVHVAWKTGGHDFVHEADLEFDAGFQPVRRR